MRDLPAGTVTFLFTDVEGSTRILEELGAERYADALGEHRRLLREAFTAHGGVEVDTQGDAFFVAFATAAGALRAAAQAQEALEPGRIRVRIGLHTGTPLVTEEGYVGADVHRAARIAAAGRGGQVLLSDATRGLLDADDELRDLGLHRLKDLTAPQRLYQLGRDDFGPLATLDATNLPVAASPPVGRAREIDELTKLLSNGSRLVTITGPGGTGKTRLALQVASELVGRLKDGVFWVPLAPLADPSLVVPTIGDTIGAQADVAGHLRDRELLLVLDNAEHLLGAAPDLGSLVEMAPKLRMLVTSRAPLHVSAEREYPLDPLPIVEAVALFCERARAVGRDIVPEATVTAICVRLDGLPLAIELAAARTKLLDPPLLLERLEQRLPLLTGGPRDAPERQQTLRATIGWSHALLDEQAKRLFARLAVFVGGCSLEAAEAVCDADLEALAALVDMSLVKATGDGRFLMLETIREYAAERLADSGEAVAVARRHAGYYAAFADEFDEARRRPGGAARAEEQLGREQGNVRAALTAARTLGETTLEITILAKLSDLFLRGSQGDFRSMLERALEAGSDDERLMAYALGTLAFAAYRQADYPAARMAAERACVLAEETGSHRSLGSALSYIAALETGEGRFDEANRLYVRAIAAFRVAGDGRSVAVALLNVGDVALSAERYEDAIDRCREALDATSTYGDPTMRSTGLMNLATAFVQLGRVDDAEEANRESLTIARELDDTTGITCSLRVAAAIAAHRGEPERAALLLGGAEQLRESIELSLEPSERVLQDDVVSRLREALGAGLEPALAAGAALDADAASELALEGTP